MFYDPTTCRDWTREQLEFAGRAPAPCRCDRCDRGRSAPLDAELHRRRVTTLVHGCALGEDGEGVCALSGVGALYGAPEANRSEVFDLDLPGSWGRLAPTPPPFAQRCETA